MKNRMLLAIALASSVSAAYASPGQASIKLTNITLTAFDLVPSDEYLPSFEFISGAPKTSAHIATYGPGIEFSEGQVADGFLAPLSVSYSGASVNASASFDATSLEMTTTASGDYYITSTLFGSGSLDSTLEYYGQTSAPYLQIRVAPGTGILLSGTADISTSSDCTGRAFGDCYVIARLAMSVGSVGDSQQFTYSGGYQGPFGAVFTNFSSSFRDVNVRIDGEVQMASVPSSNVPEPSSHALLMAGCVVVAGVARRRKSRQ
ncbi:MAG: PEP-CTERM sorting domain-containing protein [Rubrivivax sp.]|nr:MAG: PEP-CTERM sorting domain-containing protein [Rubrivivax sp.]